jgi:hypothetical protein
MKRILVASLMLLAICLTGCVANITASKAPDADLTKLKTFYVKRLPADNRGIEKLISKRLVAMGYQSRCGDLQAPPSGVDAFVTYEDRWNWDMTMFMSKLDIQVRDASTQSVLASGQSTRSSLKREPPEAMVREVLVEVFR